MLHTGDFTCLSADEMGERSVCPFNVKILSENEDAIGGGIKQTGEAAAVIFDLGLKLSILHGDGGLVSKTRQQSAVIG